MDERRCSGLQCTIDVFASPAHAEKADNGLLDMFYDVVH